MESFTWKENESQTYQYQHDMAESGDRFLARLIDGGIALAIGLLCVLIGLTANDDGNMMILLFACGFVSFYIYQAYLLTTKGQTIGKRIMKIKIVKIDTEENGGFVTNVLLRSIVNYIIASFVPFYGLIDILFIFSSEKRCLHDKIASTKVVRA